MKKIQFGFALLLSLFFWTSCVQEEQFNNTPMGNFEACWNSVNERYCFFEYKKKEYGLDWDAVYDEYKAKVSPNMTRDSLFIVLGDMLCELRDGHVNLYSSFNISRYWKWFTDYPLNFDPSLQRAYLGWDYRIAGGLSYKMLPDSIGYVYYASFSSPVGEANLNEVLYYFKDAKGIIFDIRDNGGGTLTNVDRIAARFTREAFLSGYIQHKTGSGHGDFSELHPFYQIATPEGYLHWSKPVILLQNRRVFSAANQFLNVMGRLPQVTTLGDRSGGGSGLPFNSVLPCGWSMRFSASPIYNVDQQHTEFGIDPEVRVDLLEEDKLRGKDTIIEHAIALIKKS